MKSDVQELRILNRIVRHHANSPTYEADPRHVELLSRSLDLGSCRIVGTPGTKDDPDFDSVELDEPEEADAGNQHVVNSIQSQPPMPSQKIPMRARHGILEPVHQEVRFAKEVQVHNVHSPYSLVYGKDIKRLFFTGGVGSRNYKMIPAGFGPFTGKTFHAMAQRRAEQACDSARRQAILKLTLQNGAAWELSSSDSLQAFMLVNVVSKKGFKKKRPGNKAVKHAEALQNLGPELTPDQATMYRALAAR